MIDLNNQKIKVPDPTQLYFERPIVINQSLIIHQPSVGNIIDFGEEQFYKMLYIFVGNTTMFRLSLWKSGIDWNKLSDYELFCGTVTSLKPSDTFLLFGDLNFSQFKPQEIKVEEKEQIVLINEKQMIYIDEDIYNQIAYNLRTMFNFFPKNEFARGRLTKEAMIWEEEENLKMQQKQGYRPFLLSLISGCLNHPGFKYKKKELEDVGIFEFMDSVQRLQIYESATALLKGVYSGFVDASKIDKKEFDFMRESKKTP